MTTTSTCSFERRVASSHQRTACTRSSSTGATAGSSTGASLCSATLGLRGFWTRTPGRAFGAAVKQLYLSGPARGAGLCELLAHNESMETEQPEFNLGRPAPASASGSATPTFGLYWEARAARDAAG